MLNASATVYVVDDDVSVRESLELLIGSAGWQSETFASAQDFLTCPLSLAPSCLILDVGRFASLSRREREVMTLVVSGMLNKQVGGELGIGEITVKAHRGRAMQKMKAESFADLVTMAAELGISSLQRS
ncbi:MAG: LuxR C-terminal-related transcriptional regulator [bacterium]